MELYVYIKQGNLCRFSNGAHPKGDVAGDTYSTRDWLYLSSSSSESAVAYVVFYSPWDLKTGSVPSCVTE